MKTISLTLLVFFMTTLCISAQISAPPNHAPVGFALKFCRFAQSVLFFSGLQQTVFVFLTKEKSYLLRGLYLFFTAIGLHLLFANNLQPLVGVLLAAVGCAAYVTSRPPLFDEMSLYFRFAVILCSACICAAAFLPFAAVLLPFALLLLLCELIAVAVFRPNILPTEPLPDLEKIRDDRLFLTAEVLHEFRTPLSLIAGNADLLLKYPQTNLAQRLQIILFYTNALRTLSDNLLDLTTDAYQNPDRKNVPKKLSDYLARLTDSFRPLALEKKIHLSFHAAASDTAATFAPGILQKILTNLLDNALKFTPAYGTVRVESSENKTTNNIEISVSDTGCGIDSEALEKVFLPFFKSENESDRTLPGTGLGLSITRRLVGLLHGEISVTSDPDRGTCFRLCLPLQAGLRLSVPPRRTDNAGATATKSSNGFGTLSKVLIIEDNPDVRDYLCDIFYGLYSVSTAANGEIGLLKAAAEKPAVIILDEYMPVLSGFSVLSALKENPDTRGISVIMLTARAGRAEELRALRLRAAHFLSKPCDAEKLLLLLSRCVALFHAQNQDRSEKNLREYWNRKHVTDRFMLDALQILEDKFSDKKFRSFHLKYALQKKGHGAERKTERCIKEKFGTTPAKLIRAFRLGKAKHYLQTVPSLSVPLIIERAGLDCDQSYFIKMYKSRFGHTPKDERN